MNANFLYNICPVGFGALRNRLQFPTIHELPDEFDGTNVAYYVQHDGVWVKRRTWSLLGEILQLNINNRRNWMQARDSIGNRFLIVLPDEPSNGTFKWSSLKMGHTVCVRFAERRIFFNRPIDPIFGASPDNREFVKIIKCNLNDLTKLSDLKYERLEINVCWWCDEPANQICLECGLAYYCTVECEAADSQYHEKFCRLLADYMDLVKINFHESVNFNSASKAFRFHL